MIYGKFLTIAIMAAAVSASHKNKTERATVPTEIINGLSFTCSITRGILSGFEEGYFMKANNKISDKCLDESW